MPLTMGRVLSTEDENSAASATEYRESFLSPRREDYIPNVALPKIGPNRPPSNRSFLTADVDPRTISEASEYRLCYENYHPKRPYCYHAKPSHVFDYVPKPLARKSPRYASLLSLATLRDTEYQERFPNYQSFIPVQELLPPHLAGKASQQSETQQKREHMSRSQYFHQLVNDSEKQTGGQRIVGVSEQRTAFQWPQKYPPPQQKPSPPKETPNIVYPTYKAARNIYEPLPIIQRPVVNATN